MIDLSTKFSVSSSLVDAYRLSIDGVENPQEIVQLLPDKIGQKVLDILKKDTSERTKSERIRDSITEVGLSLYHDLDGISKKIVHMLFARYCGHSMLKLNLDWAIEHIKDADKVSLLLKSIETQFMFKEIEQWAGGDRHRNIVFNNIMRFIYNFDGESTSLDLSNLELDCLPDIFMNSDFRDRLKSIKLNKNRLTFLPPSFSLLKNLEKLYLKSNLLESVPSVIYQLRRLEVLNLSSNPIQSFADSISELQLLKRLIVKRCNLQGLPESISEITSLEELNLEKNQLRDLPVGLGRLSALEILDLSENQLTTIPQSMENMESLVSLFLPANQIREVPAFLFQIPRLTDLALDGNPIQLLPDTFIAHENLSSLFLRDLVLRDLPNSILSLDPSCDVFLQNSGLSRLVQRRIIETMQAAGYSGPTFHFSVQETRLMHQKNIDEYLTELCEKAVCNPKSLALNYPQIQNTIEDPEKERALKDWLSRILLMQDTDRATPSEFYQKILSYLDLAEKDPLFCECFFNIIQGATKTCGDRMALSVLHVGLNYKMATFDKMNLKKFADFIIQGPWMIDQLEIIARHKVLSLKFVDEIEVFLAYPVKLKERLNLEIDVDKMLYFACSRVTQDELDRAAEYIEGMIGSEDAIYNILIERDEWIQALKLSYPTQLASIEQQRSDMLALVCEAESSTAFDTMQVDHVYKENLLNLTRQVLRKRSHSEI